MPNITVDFTSTTLLHPLTFGLDETAYQSPNTLPRDANQVAVETALGLSYQRMDLHYTTTHDPNSKIITGAGGGDTTPTGDQWIAAIKQCGCAPCILTPYDTIDAANLVDHFNRTAGTVDTAKANYVPYWVIGNEPDINGLSVAQYSTNFNAAYDAMKAIDPNIKIGGPTISFYSGSFISTFLTNCGSRADFLDFHGYPQQGTTNTPLDPLFTWAVGTGNSVADAYTRITAAGLGAHGNSMFVQVGEWSLNWGSPIQPNQFDSNFGVVWCADVLLNIIKNRGVSLYFGSKGNMLEWAANTSKTDWNLNQTVVLALDAPKVPYHGYTMFTGAGLFKPFGPGTVNASTTLTNVDVIASPQSMVVVNKDSSLSKAYDISFVGQPVTSVDIWQHNQTMMFNAPPVKITTVGVVNNQLTFTAPAMSVTTFVFPPTNGANFLQFVSPGGKVMPPQPAPPTFVYGLNPTSGTPGTTVSIGAANFTPNSALSVFLYGGAAATITSGGTTDVNGFTIVQFTVPNVAAKSYPVVVTDQTLTDVGPPFTVQAVVPPNTFTVPDRRNATDPNDVIDPSLVKDSTSGMQRFIDSCPSDATIVLPFDIVVNHQIVLDGTQVLRSVDVSNPRKIFKTESYPWRVMPDDRPTVNGVPNQFYNPNGACAAWQYDIFGGQAQIPNSMNNPWGDHSKNGSGQGGYDGHAGYWDTGYDGVHFSSRYAVYGPNGNQYPFKQSHVGKVFSAYINSGQSADTNSSTDSNGLGMGHTVAGGTTIRTDAFFFYGGHVNGLLVNPSPAGAFQAKTRIISVAADNKSAMIDKPALLTLDNVIFTVQPTTQYNKFISSVSTDGSTVFFADSNGVVVDDHATGTTTWSIGDSTTSGFKAVFLPNPSYNTYFWPGNPNHSFAGYFDTLNVALGRMDDAVVLLTNASSLIGVEVAGPNTGQPVGTSTVPGQIQYGSARTTVTNLDKSEPLVAEFQHLVSTRTIDNQVLVCNIHHAWGDAQNGPATLYLCYLRHTGRQGCVGSFDNMSITNCVFDDHRHSAIDIEDPVGNVHPGITINNNCFGFPHGVALSTAVSGFSFQGNHSTQADVDNGLISGLCGPMHTAWKAKGSTGMVISNNNFEAPTADLSAVFQIGGAPDQVIVTNNIGVIGPPSNPNQPRPAYFLQNYGLSDKSDRITNLTCTGNQGGPLMTGGQVTP